jgi:hypothetical protein
MSPSEAMKYVKWAIGSWPSRSKRADSIRSPSAIPTAVEMPCPSGPVVVSTPGTWPYSGWPAHGDPS